MKVIRGRLTYANVASSLALFIALGGGATAATVAIKNSKQIAPGAVNSGDVANNSLTSADLKNGAGVGAGDLTPAARAALRGPTGAQGPAGPQGPAGAAGAPGEKGDPGVVPSPQTPVTITTFANGWKSYDSGTVSTDDDQPLRVWKDFQGVVHLEGAVTDSDATVNGETIFRLPEGYRPAPSYMNFPVVTSGFSDFNEVLGMLFVYGSSSPNTTGTVEFQGGNDEYVSLDGITFRAAS